MIEKIEGYKAVCDKCNESFDIDGVVLHFDSINLAIREMKDYGCYFKKDKCYCPDCRS